MKKILISITIIINIINASDHRDNDYAVYLFGIVEHFYPVSQTKEGNMHYVSLSKKEYYKEWEFENGLGYYKDSYNIDSFNIYTNISNSNWAYGMLKPLVSLAVHSKGIDYSSDERKIFILPSIKIRIGENKGLFFNIMPIPKIKPYTNGFVATEIGYSF